MASNEELPRFVKEALARGATRPQIEEALKTAGWTLEQVRDALRSFAEVDFPIPVPRPRPQLDAREAFLYLVQFVTLYVSAYNLGGLIFDLINRAFPDPAAAQYQTSTFLRAAIRWEVSSLIVSVPVFLYMSWFIGRDIRRDPNKRHSKMRRRLTYVTLFVAAIVLIGDVITLIYNLLGGELTTRFMLKALTVGVIAGASYGYYLADLRREESVSKS